MYKVKNVGRVNLMWPGSNKLFPVSSIREVTDQVYNAHRVVMDRWQRGKFISVVHIDDMPLSKGKGKLSEN